MQTHLLPKFRIGSRLLLLLLAGIFFGTASSLSAAKGSWRSLNLKIAADRQTATVMVPEGMASVSLQRYQGPGGWKTVNSQGGVVGSFTFDLTSDSKKIQWRALGWYVGGTVSRDKFPAKFYKGKKSFGPIKSAAASRPASLRLDYMRALPLMVQDTEVKEQVPTATPGFLH